MTSEQERRGALEALDRILNRGGDADDVLRDVLVVLFRLYAFVGINFLEHGELVAGPALGTRTDHGSALPISFGGVQVAELEVGPAAPDEDRPFLERVALLVSPYCLVGWDTGGERWSP